MKHLSLIFLLNALLIYVCLGDIPPDAIQKMDEAMQAFVALDQFSGSVLVAKDGMPFFAKAFGEADKDFRIPNSLQTKFNIGSIGKTFTGVAIMQLAEQGKLDVNDPAVKYLPDFPFGGKITLHHLLTHTAGTFNYFAHPDFQIKNYSIRGVQDALPLIYDQKLLFENPGERFEYSNSGIVILGAVIEAVSGQSYPDYIRDHILLPSGMNDTGIYYPDQVNYNRATGYIKTATGGYRRNIFSVPSANADGGIESTVEDMLKFDQMLYGTKLLNEESKTKMFTPFKEDYAYCWGIEQLFGNTIIGHSGGAPGVSAQFKRYTTDRYTIIILSNYDRAAHSVFRVIEAILFNQSYDQPRKDLTAFLCEYLSQHGSTPLLTNAESILSENKYSLSSSRLLNELGYSLLNEKKLDWALAIFKVNAQFFPAEPNPYDSLAEAYLLSGDRESAIHYYRKALEIDPNFSNAKQNLERLTK